MYKVLISILEKKKLAITSENPEFLNIFLKIAPNTCPVGTLETVSFFLTKQTPIKKKNN